MNTVTATPSRGLKSFFVRDGRLRSGWRVALYLLASIIVMIGGLLLIGILAGLTIGAGLAAEGVSQAEIAVRIQAMFTNLFDSPVLALGVQSMRVVLGLALIWIFRRFVDKRSFRALGFQMPRGWLKEFGAGVALVLAMWLVIFALSLVTGAASVTGFAWQSSDALAILGALAFGFGFNLLVGVIEEADARGYMLQNLAEGIRFAPAVVVSSAYFGILHLLNPGAGLFSTLGIFFAGITLAMGYYLTGRLWFSIGMHAAWNFAEGPLFGFLVSGLNMGGVFQLQITGPEWLMGGAFGPEAGALAVAAEIGMIGILFGWKRSARHA
ncbi:MAG: CPBP family intramembrane metalloprotease [Chloroflexi bacterium]|nr:CPBP family intramembrane metalloprotease [Chloroflexota bacterium]